MSSSNNFPVPGLKPIRMVNCGKSRIKSSTENGRTRRKPWRPQRTSTPVDSSVGTSASDTTESYFESVSELFYQSWKSELDNCEQVKFEYQLPASGNIFQNVNFVYNYNNLHSNWYPNQVVFVTTITPYIVLPVAYPAVGYRADGTYGVLPGIWYSYYR